MNQIASSLAFILGIMSIVAGGKAMLGWNPGYSVLPWLPVYNFVMGILTFIPDILIWINSRYATLAAIGTFGVHMIVLLLLQTVYRVNVASQSIAAMIFRLVIWIIILALLYFQVRRQS